MVILSFNCVSKQTVITAGHKVPPKAWVIFTSHIALWKFPATCSRPKKLVYNSYLSQAYHRPLTSVAASTLIAFLDFCSMYEFRALKLLTRDMPHSPRNFLICPVLPGGKVLCIWSQKQGFLRLERVKGPSTRKKLWPEWMQWWRRQCRRRPCRGSRKPGQRVVRLWKRMWMP